MRLWAHGDLPGAEALAGKTGFTRIRALLQLRMPLASADGVAPLSEDVLLQVRHGSTLPAVTRSAAGGRPARVRAWTRPDYAGQDGDITASSSSTPPTGGGGTA